MNGFLDLTWTMNYSHVALLVDSLFRIEVHAMVSIISGRIHIEMKGTLNRKSFKQIHYNDVIMSAMASQITSLTIVYSTVYSGVDQRKHQSSASLPFVQGIHR